MALVVDYALSRSVLSGLLKSLKSFKVSIKQTVEELASVLRNAARTGISSVDNVLSTLKVNKTATGFLTVANDIPISKLERIIKSADLDGLANLTNSASKVTSKEKAAFKEVIGETAESQLHNLDELTSSASKSTKYADLHIRNVTSATPASTLKKLKSAESKFLKYGKPGAVIALTVGVAYVVVDGLTKATADRTGCFMVTNINGKTQSCKVSNLTCSSEASNGVLCGSDLQKFELNTILALLSLGTPSQEVVHIRAVICQDAGIEYDDYMTKFDKIINNSNFDKIYDFVTSNIKDISANNNTAICSLPTINDVDKKLPLCRMCDPGAAPLSTTFVDSSTLADNITFECRNPTILDTIIDIGKSTGQDLLEGIATPIWNFVKPFAVAVGVFAVIAFVISLVMRLMNQSKKNSINLQQATAAAAAASSLPSSSIQYSRFIN